MSQTIGVVVATYNGEKYISEQLDSIINQTRQPDVIVISDGGSTDSTLDVCESVLKESGIDYKLLKSSKKLSVKDNFQKGFINCDAEFIFFSDQDDFWLPHKIELTMKYLSQENVVMAFTNATIVDQNLNPMGNNLWSSISFDQKGTKIFDQLDKKYLQEICKHNIVTGMCLGVRSSLKSTLLPFSENGIHDVWIAHLAITKGKVAAINEETVLYRQHGNNVVGSTTNLQKSLSHANGYFDRLVARISFINDVETRIGDIEASYIAYYELYKKHLIDRKQFIIREKNPFFYLTRLNSYRLFENKYFQIFLKDLIVSLRKKLRG